MQFAIMCRAQFKVDGIESEESRAARVMHKAWTISELRSRHVRGDIISFAASGEIVSNSGEGREFETDDPINIRRHPIDAVWLVECADADAAIELASGLPLRRSFDLEVREIANSQSLATSAI